MNKPYLIIVGGPTASGKSSLAEKVIKHAKLNSNTYENVIIDNLVESNPYFKKKVSEYIKELKLTKTNEEIIEMFSNPHNDLIQIFNDYYYFARSKTDCNTGSECENTKNEFKGECNTCGKLNDMNLRNGLETGKNVVFETMVTYWPKWIFDEYNKTIKNHNYQIIIAWSIVDLCELIDRNKKRTLEVLKTFLEDDTSIVPRLPEIRIKEYTEVVRKIIETFTPLKI